MEITDVRLRMAKAIDEPLKAIANITLDNEFVVNDLRVVVKNGRLVVTMPCKRTPDGELRDIAYPINRTVRDKFERAILDEYNRIIELEEEFLIYGE